MAHCRMFRFTVTGCRSKDAEAVQLTSLHFRRGEDAASLRGARVKSVGSRCKPSEGPASAIDGRMGTQWRDEERKPLVITLVHTGVDSFAFTTGKENPEDDPVSWLMEGSESGITWVVLHEELGYGTPLERRRRTEWFRLAEPELVHEEKEEEEESWTVSAWLGSVDVHSVLLKAAAENTSGEDQVRLLRELGASDSSGFCQLLRNARALELLAQVLLDSAKVAEGPKQEEEPEWEDEEELELGRRA